MSEQNNQPIDPLWADFEAAEVLAAEEELERAYEEIAGFNSAILNQVAGLAKTTLTAGDVIGNRAGMIVPKAINISHRSGSLYLQPDRYLELRAQGKEPELGNPYVIRGAMPPATVELIDDMLAATEAVKDDRLSAEGSEMWRGNVAGQPVIFKLQTQESVGLDPAEPNKIVPLTSLHVYRDDIL
jgi:hypothetical protein